MSTIFAHSGESINNGFNDHMMNGGHWANDNGTMMFWGMLLVIIVGVAMTVFVVTSNKSRSTSSNNALEVLKHRYAKGEITKKQYEDIKKDIS